MTVIHDVGGASVLPEAETRDITAYTTATGTFTTTAFGTALAAGDIVTVSHISTTANPESMFGRKVINTSLVIGAAGGDDLFTVTGKNLITLMHGEMTTVEAAATGSLTIALNMKANSVDLVAATSVYEDAAGTLYMVSGDKTDTLNAGETPTVDHASTQVAHSPFIVDGDVIELTSLPGGGTSDGEILWTIYYVPLEAGAGIVAAS